MWGEFNFGLYLSNVISTLYKAEFKIYQLSKRIAYH